MYPIANVQASQYVLDVCVRAFSMLRGQDTEVHETYHVEGCVFYSGGNRTDKSYLRKYYCAKDWLKLFENKTQILWKEQQPLEYSEKFHAEMNNEVALTSWYEEKQHDYKERLIEDEIYDCSTDDEC